MERSFLAGVVIAGGCGVAVAAVVTGSAILLRGSDAGLDTTVLETEGGRRDVVVMVGLNRGWPSAAMLSELLDSRGGSGVDRVRRRRELMVREASYGGGYVAVVNCRWPFSMCFACQDVDVGCFSPSIPDTSYPPRRHRGSGSGWWGFRYPSSFFPSCWLNRWLGCCLGAQLSSTTKVRYLSYSERFSKTGRDRRCKTDKSPRQAGSYLVTIFTKPHARQTRDAVIQHGQDQDEEGKDQ